MRVVGTAGHVDHGKSTLVAALTGTHPDRLKEEREREMTIELGFAWFTLPNGEPVGIVDVPGHRDFIENMLAGVGGIDAALFVVAADEGVMPQTREHLAILNILQIPAGIIALTKTDLVDDPDWLDLVEADIRDVVANTILDQVPIVRVSARKATGIQDLKTALADCLAQQPNRPDLGRPRLPIDRVFTISGFGTVVTGTLIDGQLKSGDEVEVLPTHQRARVRGLQTHKKKSDSAFPGSRTAVNLSGIEVDQIQRGNVLVRAGQYQPTQRMDVQFRLVDDASAPLKHSSEVKLFIGASEVVARIRLLGKEEFLPGEEGFLQLELRDPVVAVRGDRYILRRPSPGETLGGGFVIESHARRRHKRFDENLLARLHDLSKGSPADVLAQALNAAGVATLQELTGQAHLSDAQLDEAVQELLEDRRAVLLEEGPQTARKNMLLAGASYWSGASDRAVREVDEYHRSFPLRRGMPREALKSRLKMQPRVFQAALRQWIESDLLLESGSLISTPEHRVRFNPQQQAEVNWLLDQFRQAPYSPPSVKESITMVGEDVYNALVDQGELIPVSSDVVFQKSGYEQMVNAVQDHFQKQETLTVVEFRDQFGTSRKYALAFLEHLDSIGVTIRTEDVRKLKNISANR